MDIVRSVFHYLSRCLFGCCRCLRKQKLTTNDLEGIAEYMLQAKNVIVMTGAGISTNANIPDFRSKSFGLYNRLQKYNLPHPTDVFTLSYFKRDPIPFYDIASSLYPIMTTAKPTIAHYFIKLLNDKGILLRHYTQNIDGLEDLTQLDQEKTIQAHGHIRSGTCLNCNESYSFEYIKRSVINKTVPLCEKCSGTIKPDIVLFGEGLPAKFWKHLIDFPKCDLLIIMGTSLVVQPFAGLAGKVDYNCPRLLVNRDPVGDPNMLGSILTPLLGLNPDFGSNQNRYRDVFCQNDCDEGCLELARLMGWEHELINLVRKGNQLIDYKRSQPDL